MKPKHGGKRPKPAGEIVLEIEAQKKAWMSAQRRHSQSNPRISRSEPSITELWCSLFPNGMLPCGNARPRNRKGQQNREAGAGIASADRGFKSRCQRQTQK